ncbi:hypothetical protein MKZ07_08445 [Paenibacillus sp. FSL P4-0338]|uniref:hypothetical protein n=1 Tax=Paenibacillus sp. FSL P4-0338 TaxID=2921635 RepID=UPI0030F81210
MLCRLPQLIKLDDYSSEVEIKKELMYGYKDYWELLGITNSRTVLNCRDKNIRDEIHNIFNGGILERGDHSPWNYQFQYYLSSWFEESGFKVSLEEPDFKFIHKGRSYGVAAKRLNGKGNISDNIRKAEKQIQATSHYGFIALCLDNLHKLINQNILSFNNPDKSIRDAEDIVNTILRSYLKSSNFTSRTSQILGIIAVVSFPYYLYSGKPTFELGYTSYLSFLPIQSYDSPEWNEVISIQSHIKRVRLS